MFEDMGKVVSVVHRGVSKQFQARRLLAVEHFHTKSHRLFLEDSLAREPCALIIGDASGVTLVLKRHRLVLEVAPHDALRLFTRLTRLPNCFICLSSCPEQRQQRSRQHLENFSLSTIFSLLTIFSENSCRSESSNKSS